MDNRKLFDMLGATNTFNQQTIKVINEAKSIVASNRRYTKMSYLNGEIDSNCYMVLRGKPAAVMPVKNEKVNCLVKRVTELFGLKVFKKTLSDSWTELWIYKKDFMLDVIRSLPEKPKTIYDHWVLGKVFGYSDEAIEEFIRN